jgi:hypothetical protein
VPRHIKVLSVIFCFISASIASAQPVQPKHIKAVYEVTKNGMPFAKVHEQFVISGNTYKAESITKGIGIYALFGERKLSSVGELTSLGLKPTHFELQQGDNPKKAMLADFDWPKNMLRMTVKGEVKEAELAAGTQDLASYAYQFMFLPMPLKNDIVVTLTTGKKLNQYPYKINTEQEVLEVAGTPYKTLHLLPPAPQDANKPQETKELWLAVEHYYVPVRILIVDDNGQKLEQTLTELHVE